MDSKYERAQAEEAIDKPIKDGISNEGKESKGNKKVLSTVTNESKRQTATAAAATSLPLSIASVAMEWKECREEYTKELERINTRFQRR
jgi:hypothetical protein